MRVCHCLQKSEKSFQVGGENVILQGAELPASFTYILVFPRGTGGKEASAAGASILLLLQHLHAEYAASANNCFMAKV